MNLLKNDEMNLPDDNGEKWGGNYTRNRKTKTG